MTDFSGIPEGHSVDIRVKCLNAENLVLETEKINAQFDTVSSWTFKRATSHPMKVKFSSIGL